MKVLLTGNNGYIGSVLQKELINKGYEVIGLDNNYFEDCNFLQDVKPSTQIIKDIRDVNVGDLENIDYVIHLAGLANDPLGELAPHITEEVNYLDHNINDPIVIDNTGVWRDEDGLSKHQRTHVDFIHPQKRHAEFSVHVGNRSSLAIGLKVTAEFRAVGLVGRFLHARTVIVTASVGA